MEMIECAPWRAMISPAACLARWNKARAAPDPFNGVGYVGLEKCLSCPVGAELAGADPPQTTRDTDTVPDTERKKEKAMKEKDSKAQGSEDSRRGRPPCLPEPPCLPVPPCLPENPETRACKTCGVEKPIDAFAPYNKDKSRRIGVCRSCMSEKASRAARGRKRNPYRRKPPQASGVPSPEKTPLPPGRIVRKPTPEKTPLPPGSIIIPPPKVLRICFDDYPDLYHRLIGVAVDEIRTPEEQVLYWIQKGVERLPDSTCKRGQPDREKKGGDHVRSV